MNGVTDLSSDSESVDIRPLIFRYLGTPRYAGLISGIYTTSPDRDVTRGAKLAGYLANPVNLVGQQIVVLGSSPTTAKSLISSMWNELDQTRPISVLIPAVPVIPAWRVALERAIHDSSWIASLGDDWDGEGSPGVARTTWDRCVYVLGRLADRCEELGRSLEPPAINPNGQGSIDLYWARGARGLLVNVPADTDDPVYYSATVGPNLDLTGALDAPGKVDLLIEFLTA
jgi:hypothetical protein